MRGLISTPTEPLDKSLWWWALSNVVCGVLGSITGLAVPAFIPADAVMVTASLASVSPAAMGPPNAARMMMGIKDGGTDEHEVHEEGKTAFELAHTAVTERNLAELEKQRASEDVQAIRKYFLDDSYEMRASGPHYEIPPHLADQMQHVLSSDDPMFTAPIMDVPPPPPKSKAPPSPATGLHRRGVSPSKGRPSSFAFVSFTDSHSAHRQTEYSHGST